MYIVWSDSESEVEYLQTFDSIDEACERASEFVHSYDGEPFRVIINIDDEDGETIDTYENYPNPCDF